MRGDNPVAAIQTTWTIFQIYNAKLYVPVVTLSVNNNIKFLKNIKQGFKRTISWKKNIDLKQQHKQRTII